MGRSAGPPVAWRPGGRRERPAPSRRTAILGGPGNRLVTPPRSQHLQRPALVHAVVGASGAVGGAVAAALLQSGARVRVIGRSAERLRPLVAAGGEPRIAAIEDERAMSEALRGAAAAFLMTPPLQLTPGGLTLAGLRVLGERLAVAVARAGVRRVVQLSGLGAHLASPPLQIALLRDQEQELARQGGAAELAHLRPGFFMENLLELAAPARSLGVLPYTLAPELPVPMVATRDVAAVAAGLLLAAAPWSATAIDLVGPRDRTMNEVARILGGAVGRPTLAYLRLGDDQVERSLLQAGVAQELVASALELNRFINGGHFRAASDSPPRHLTPTALEDFAPALADAFRRAAPRAP